MFREIRIRMYLKALNLWIKVAKAAFRKGDYQEKIGILNLIRRRLHDPILYYEDSRLFSMLQKLLKLHLDLSFEILQSVTIK